MARKVRDRPSLSLVKFIYSVDFFIQIPYVLAKWIFFFYSKELREKKQKSPNSNSLPAWKWQKRENVTYFASSRST